MGQTRQELPGRDGILISVRCACCGEPLAGGAVMTAVLRDIGYEYCGERCRDRHAEQVTLEPDRCSHCDLDAVGDTDRCAVHLDSGPDADLTGAGGYPLAS